MTDKIKWCPLCQRQVVPKKNFNAIGWVGFVLGAEYLVAVTLNEQLAPSLTNNTVAAALTIGVGNIMLYVLLLLVAPLFLISLLYCVYYSVREPRCPICNSRQLTEARWPG
jgi:prepilin signal peptidase PulO-like enzyme (type II secretory pathway)